MSITREQLRHAIALTIVHGIGPNIAKQLIAYCGGVDRIFSLKHQELVRIPNIGERIARELTKKEYFEIADREIDFMDRNSITPLFYLDDNYPALLKQCADSPLLLYVRGTIPEVSPNKWISIVGTRRASPYGREFTHRLLKELHEMGHRVMVVSGLAHGIDGEAHKAALENGFPTVAVMGHGLRHMYPPSHRELARRMLANGALVSDFTSDRQPDNKTFLQRNRIIAGLSAATIVVESAVKGGAMVTAGLAFSYNRDVLALPGNAGRELSSGCNRIIKSHKASMIEGAEDLEKALGWSSPSGAKPKQHALLYNPSEEETFLLKLIEEAESISVDELARVANMPMNKLNALLLNLEFNGVLHQLPGRIYESTR